jgi:glycosyltransferase involved in cell wall biosynthesis
VVAVGREVSQAANDVRCLVYAPYSFSGRGPAESCAQIAGGMAAAGVRMDVHVGRSRTPLPDGVAVREPFPLVTHRLPWHIVEKPALRRLDVQFRKSIASADPRTTVAHFWPGTPADAVEAARDRGIVTVREMINSACAISGPILDEAYARLGLPPTHGVSREVIEGETAELRLYDYFFASNPEVERSLLALGVQPEQILPTSFGWRPERFDLHRPDARSSVFRAVFVGRIGVRKGVPELLEAWASVDTDGELVLVGSVDDEIRDLVEAHTRSGRVQLAGYVNNPAGLYAGSDVFVFPTWEEGGPQVTYEAAACGLPIVTTPMGAARLVSDGCTGVVVEPGSVAQIRSAIQLLADNPETRRTYGAAAAAAAAEFTYRKVGAHRAEQLSAVLHARNARSAH